MSNFSLQYPCTIQQTGNENTQMHQVEVVILIQLQILVTNLQGNVSQQEGRINNQILGVKGLTEMMQQRLSYIHVLLLSLTENSFIINRHICECVQTEWQEVAAQILSNLQGPEVLKVCHSLKMSQILALQPQE